MSYVQLASHSRRSFAFARIINRLAMAAYASELGECTTEVGAGSGVASSQDANRHDNLGD